MLLPRRCGGRPPIRGIDLISLSIPTSRQLHYYCNLKSQAISTQFRIWRRKNRRSFLKLALQDPVRLLFALCSKLTTGVQTVIELRSLLSRETAKTKLRRLAVRLPTVFGCSVSALNLLAAVADDRLPRKLPSTPFVNRQHCTRAELYEKSAQRYD